MVKCSIIIVIVLSISLQYLGNDDKDYFDALLVWLVVFSPKFKPKIFPSICMNRHRCLNDC